MHEVTMLELRADEGRVLERLGNGERLLLIHDGRAIARLEPVGPEPAPLPADDPVYHLDDYSFEGPGGKLDNAEIDRIVHGG